MSAVKLEKARGALAQEDRGAPRQLNAGPGQDKAGAGAS